MAEKTDLEKTEELFAFLQGEVPDGFKIADDYIPRLTAEQAWTAIWYLGEQHWQVPDHISRCGVCGVLFDSNREGGCLDYGDAPYHFCDGCYSGPIAEAKRKEDPDQ
jgi:hypothetical protein